MPNNKIIVLKISGKGLGTNKSIYDNSYIDNFINILKKCISKLNVKFLLITGGGNIWRGAFDKTLNVDNSDYMGMTATLINGIFLTEKLKISKIKALHLSNLPTPNIKKYSKTNILKLFDKNNVIVLSGGTGKTRCTTDSASILVANDIKANYILFSKNNSDGIYSKDPNIYKDAKFLNHIKFTDIKKKNLNFIDEYAAKLLARYKIKSIVFNNAKFNLIYEILENDCCESKNYSIINIK